MSQAWSEIVESLSQREFARRYPGFFLLSSSDPSELETLLQTQLTQREGRRARSGRRVFEAHWVHNEAGGPVTVGRSSSCNITFRHPSVSKQHARLEPAARGKLVVIDLNSRNGTTVNGDMLAPEKEQALAVRDRVQFGSVSCMVLDAAGLHECLSVGQ